MVGAWRLLLVRRRRRRLLAGIEALRAKLNKVEEFEGVGGVLQLHEPLRTEVEPAASRTCLQYRRANNGPPGKFQLFFLCFFIHLGSVCVCREASSFK